MHPLFFAFNNSRVILGGNLVVNPDNNEESSTKLLHLSLSSIFGCWLSGANSNRFRIRIYNT